MKIATLFLLFALFVGLAHAGTATFVGADQSNQGGVFTHGATGELIPFLDSDVLGSQTSVTITYADTWLWAWQVKDPRSIFVRDLIQPSLRFPGLILTRMAALLPAGSETNFTLPSQTTITSCSHSKSVYILSTGIISASRGNRRYRSSEWKRSRL